MKQIEINTTQNVVIQYELAMLKDRIIAFIADFIFLFIILFVGMLFFTLVGIDPQKLTYVFLMPVFIFTRLITEFLMNGQSPGKRLQHIKIVKLNGEQPELNDYIIRWAFRAIDIYFSFGVIACLLIGSSNKSQRIGDVLSNSVVVKTKSALKFNIKDLLKLDTKENYSPTYANATNLNKDEISLIHETIGRYRKYSNQAHKDALRSLAQLIAKKLDIREIPSNKEAFLISILKDYIILSR